MRLESAPVLASGTPPVFARPVPVLVPALPPVFERAAPPTTTVTGPTLTPEEFPVAVIEYAPGSLMTIGAEKAPLPSAVADRVDGASGMRAETDRLPAETLLPLAAGVPVGVTVMVMPSPGVKPVPLNVNASPGATDASDTATLVFGAG
jgi:hypothetical protein